MVSVAYASVQASGNTNILAVGWNDTVSGVVSVTDSLGNVYEPALPAVRSGGMSQAIYFAKNIAGGANAVTVSFDRAAQYVDIRAIEYAGLSDSAPLDAGTSAAGTGSSADSGLVAVSTANELVFGAGMTTTAFTSAGSGSTSRVITVPDADIIEDRIVTTVGSYSAAAKLNSGSWIMQVVAFKR